MLLTISILIYTSSHPSAADIIYFGTLFDRKLSADKFDNFL